MKRLCSLLFASATALTIFSAQAAGDPNVVATIKPVHSLVAGVMGGRGNATLVVEGAGSPHTYALSPSKAQAIAHADIVFWVGEELEMFMVPVLRGLEGEAKAIAFMDVPGITLHEFRVGGPWDPHANDDHGHAHDDHGHAHDDRGHAHDHDYHHGEHDGHIWLDPRNAAVMVEAIAAALVEADPSNADEYRANAATLKDRLKNLETEIAAMLEPVVDKPFIVFHDAYQYFEDRFGVRAAGSVTVSPERAPGARRVAEIRARVREAGAVCIFAEPQFEPGIVRTVAEGTEIRGSVLDPVGAELEAGADAYFVLLRNLARDLKDCLSD